MTNKHEIVAVAFIATLSLATSECRVHTEPTDLDGQEDVPVVVGDPLDLSGWVEDPYTIHDARIDENQLVIEVSFSGDRKSVV